MPATHVVAIAPEQQRCTVLKNGEPRPARVIGRRPGDIYVHYDDTDKRLDEWVSESLCTVLDPDSPPPDPLSRKRKRAAAGRHHSHSPEPSSPAPAAFLQQPPNGAAAAVSVPGTGARRQRESDDRMVIESALDDTNGQPQTETISEEDFDFRHHQKLTAQKNFDMVIFDTFKIKPWYYSPYPLVESEIDDVPPTNSASTSTTQAKIPGVGRPPRAHGRTIDVLARGLQRSAGASTLWVCHFCFKYMADGIPWEKHKNSCKRKHPPGKKVYQRGAHIIWEVDGAKEKLYTQCLALFGKLFIDVKTLFFDCDNFLFYILTDGNSSEDHVIGFFSKEKLSYDDYNLACIVTLPQYQRKGYGMLMIEFSYELSRREGKVGTPERPLSDLGLRSYLAYWISTLVRFFRRVLSTLPPDIVTIKERNKFPGVDNAEITGTVERKRLKKGKRSKGFVGELGEREPEAQLGMMPIKTITDPLFTTSRTFTTTLTSEGRSIVDVEVECTLEDIARATNLRVDDCAFALKECGFLMRRMRGSSSSSAGAGAGAGAGAQTASASASVVSRSPNPPNGVGNGGGGGGAGGSGAGNGNRNGNGNADADARDNRSPSRTPSHYATASVSADGSVDDEMELDGGINYNGVGGVVNGRDPNAPGGANAQGGLGPNTTLGHNAPGRGPNAPGTGPDADADADDQDTETIVITRSVVEQIARERKVKIMYLDLAGVLV